MNKDEPSVPSYASYTRDTTEPLKSFAHKGVNRRTNLTPYRRPILALTHFWCSDRRAAGGTVADSTSWGNHRRCAVRPIPRR
jgi:hypothetical protein